MKFAAAYLLACLGAEQAATAVAAAATEEGTAAALPAPSLPPTKDDVRRILGSVGAEVDEDRLDLLFALMDGKDVAELIAAGREQLAYAPPGATAAVAAGAAPAAGGEAEKDEAKKDEAKKEEEEEEEDDNMFSLFDD